MGWRGVLRAGIVAAALMASTGHEAKDNAQNEVLRRSLQNPQFDKLNALLAGLQFGDEPGPCESLSNPCSSNMAQLPAWVKNVFINYPVWYINDSTIGNAVKSGTVRIYDLACSNIAVEDIIVSGEPGSTEIPINMGIDDLRLDCNGRVSFSNLRIEFTAVFLIPVRVTISGTADLNLIKSNMNGNNNGISMNLEMGLFASEGFENEPPDNLNFKSCSANIGDSVSISDLEIINRGQLYESVAQIILNSMISGLLENIFCDVMRSAAKDQATGAPGPINEEITALRDEISRLVSLGLRERDDFEQDEITNAIMLPGIDLDRAMDLSNSTIFEAISVGLNDYLGAQSTSPGYEGDLVINEVVDQLLDNSNGVITIPDILEYNDEYPSTSGTGSLVDYKLSLKGFTIGGLNRFTFFELFNNGYQDREGFGEPYKYTALSNLQLSQIDLDLSMNLELRPGEWVTWGRNKVEIFDFSAAVSLSDVGITFASYQLVQLNVLFGLRIGQLFGEERSLADAANCALKALDHFRFSGLQATTSSISDLNLDNFVDLGPLVGNGLQLFNLAFRPTLRDEMKYLIENDIRGQINDYLDNEFFVTPFDACTEYLAQNYPQGEESFDLQSTIILEFVDEVINNLVGGYPQITANSVDINKLVQGALRYIVFEADTAINKDPNSVYTFSNPEVGTWKVDQGIDVQLTTNSDNFKLLVSGPEVQNLNSIWSLRATPSSSYDVDLNLHWGNGYLLQLDTGENETEKRGFLQFRDQIEVFAALDPLGDGTIVVYADEDFSFIVELELVIDGDVLFKVDKNSFYLSVIENLFNLSCILATLEDKGISSLEVLLANFNFGLRGRLNDNTRLGQALLDWDAAISSSGRGTVEHFLNYVISRATTTFTEVINTDFNPPYTLEACMEQESPLNGTALDTSIFVLPDFDAINKVLLEATTKQESPRGNDPREWEDFIVGPGERVFDLTIENNAFVEAISGAINRNSSQEFLISLGNTTVDPQFPSILDPLKRVFVLEEDGTVSFSLDPNSITDVNYAPNDEETLLPGIKLLWDKLVITNVDQFESVKVFQPYTSDLGVDARFSTLQDLDYGDQTLNLTLGFAIEIAKEVLSPGAEPDEILRDEIEISVQLDGVRVEAMLSVAVNQTDLSDVQMGNLFFFNESTHAFEIRPDAYNCSIKRLMYEEGLFLPQFNVTIDDMQGPTIKTTDNILNDESSEVINVFSEMLVLAFRKSFADISQGPVRQFINDVLAEIVQDAKDVDDCPGVEYPDFEQTGSFVDLHRSTFPSDLSFFVNTDLLGSGGLNINSLLERFVSDVEFGTITLFNASKFVYNGVDFGSTTWKIGSFLFENLGDANGGQVQELVLLDNTPFGADAPYTSTSMIRMDGTFELSFLLAYAFDGVFIDTSLTSDYSQEDVPVRYVENNLRFGVRFTDFYSLLNITTRVDIKAVLDLYAGDLLDLYYRPSDVSCLLSVFDYEGLVPEGLELITENLVLTIRCEGVCNSPMLESLEDTGSATGQETSGDLTEYFNNIVNALVAISGSTNAQQYINLAINSAKEECKGIPFNFTVEKPLETVDAASGMAWAGVGLGAGTIAVVAMMFPVHRRRRHELMRIAFSRLNKGDFKSKGNHVTLIERRLSSLSAHPTVPTFAKFLIPLSIILCTAMFLAANLFTVGVVVNIQFHVAGDVTRMFSLLDFTLASSINDMWNSSSYLLAVIIFIASGLWPHFKSLFLLMCFYLPSTVMGKKRRGQLLDILESLGKWSLIDVYVLIMLQVAFRFYISSSLVEGFSFLPEDLIIVDVNVVPGAAIYLFTLATMYSLIVSHVLIHYQMKAIKSDEVLEDKVNGLERPRPQTSKRPVHQHVFMVPDERNMLYGFGPAIKLIVGALLSLALVCIVAGSFLPLISFEFGGAAGVAIGLISSELQANTQSSLSIVSGILDSIPETDQLGQTGGIFLQISYVLFTLLMPVALLVVFAVLWFVPLTTTDQRRVFWLAEIVFAWDCLGILLVSIWAAILEVSQLAQFIVESATGSLCKSLRDPLLFLGVSEDGSKCFDVESTFEPLGAILVAGYLLSLAAAMLMFRLVGEAIKDREARDNGHLGKSGYCPKTTTSRWPRFAILRASVRPVSRIRRAAPLSEMPSEDAPLSVASFTLDNPAYNDIEV